MQLKIPTEVCRSYIDCQAKRAESVAGARREKETPPVVTISRQAGAGGVTLAQKMMQYLREHDLHAPCPWTVFDKQLVQKVLEDHQLSENVAKFMPEDKYSNVQDTIEELLGLHPSHWTLVEKTSETILRLSHMGNVILVGRGANVIIVLSRMPPTSGWSAPWRNASNSARSITTLVRSRRRNTSSKPTWAAVTT